MEFLRLMKCFARSIGGVVIEGGRHQKRIDKFKDIEKSNKE